MNHPPINPTYARPGGAHAMMADWNARHPDLAKKKPVVQQAIRFEVWRRCLSAHRRNERAIGMTANDYEIVMARLVSQLRVKRHGRADQFSEAVWWEQLTTIAVEEMDWEPPRRLFFKGEKQQEAA